MLGIWRIQLLREAARRGTIRAAADAMSITLEYAMGADWDDQWRTGGSLDEVVAEAHLDPAHILAAVDRFVRDRDVRRARLEGLVHP